MLHVRELEVLELGEVKQLPTAVEQAPDAAPEQEELEF